MIADVNRSVFDLSRPDGYAALRQRAEADAARTLGHDADLLDDVSGNEAFFAECQMEWFDQQSMSIPREAFADLARAKQERSRLKALYRRFFEAAVLAAVCRHQAARARRSRQHRRRLRQQ